MKMNWALLILSKIINLLNRDSGARENVFIFIASPIGRKCRCGRHMMYRIVHPEEISRAPWITRLLSYSVETACFNGHCRFCGRSFLRAQTWDRIRGLVDCGHEADPLAPPDYFRHDPATEIRDEYGKVRIYDFPDVSLRERLIEIYAVFISPFIPAPEASEQQRFYFPRQQTNTIEG